MKFLEKYKSKNNKPDCIVGLSLEEIVVMVCTYERKVWHEPNCLYI